MKAILDSCLWLPTAQLGRRALSQVKRALTTKYLPYGADPKTDKVIIESFRTDRDGFVGVPRQWGLEYARENGIEVVDKTSRGRKAVLPKTVDLREHQGPFTDRLLSIGDGQHDIVAQAATGKGKTTMALYLVQQWQTNAVIVVDQSNLRDQWVERARDQFGVPESRIGIVQGERFEYRNKDIVIAMVQTLTSREFEQEFYDYFGIAIFDEVQVFGAPLYSMPLMDFSATLRLGVSATVKRSDALTKLIYWNLGEIEAELEHKHRKSKVYYVENESVYSWYANSSSKTGRYLQEISDDSERNYLGAAIIKWLYDSGRDVLAVSDRIEQLEGVAALCGLLGIPTEHIGVYTGYRLVWGWEKDPKPGSRPAGWEKGTNYTPVRFRLLKKRTPKGVLAETKERAAVILATYKIFEKGVDVPRLSGGVDLTPRSKSKQVHGRILRELKGKYVPIWVTIRDINSYRADYQFSQRLRDYIADNAEIFQWDMEKGVRPSDVRELQREISRNVEYLKACRYTTTIDGHVTLVTPSSRRS